MFDCNRLVRRANIPHEISALVTMCHGAMLPPGETNYV